MTDISDLTRWENAPSWAKFKAQDFDGRWHWLNREPKLGFNSWLLKGAFALFIGKGETNLYWRNTLEERPRQWAVPKF